MSPRDPMLLQRAFADPFTGYARRPGWTLVPDLARVRACVLPLGVMVLSGIALGSLRTNK